MTTKAEQVLADVDQLFLDELAVNVTHRYGAGPTNETLRAFSDTVYETAFAGGISVENAAPSIILKTSDLTHVTTASIFIVGGTTYYVRGLGVDEHGVTRILLTEDSNG